MKHLYLLASALLCVFCTAAQPPAHYYSPAAGLSGAPLQASLHTIIRGHTELSYTPGLWNAYKTTDKRPGTNYVWDIYSDIPGGTPPYLYTFSTNQCGNGKNYENSCYNREHTWPQSKFGSNGPMQSDLWIVYPTDYYVNNQRGNMPYGKVGSASKTFRNGSKIGNNSYPGAPSGTCFEPIDSFKGDIARSYFYIATRYLNQGSNWSDWEMATGSVLKPWAVQMLLEWHRLDPVSTKEIDRNNAVYALQNNRNPYIDSPQYVECIWGNALACSGAQSVANTQPALTPPQVQYDFISGKIYITTGGAVSAQLMDLQGRVLEHLPLPDAALHRWEFPLHHYPGGLYLIRIHTAAGVVVQRVVFP